MRVAAAERTGLTDLPATYMHGSAAELLEAQVQANASHGLALTRKARGQVVDRLIAAAPNWATTASQKQPGFTRRRCATTAGPLSTLRRTWLRRFRRSPRKVRSRWRRAGHGAFSGDCSAG
jgi:hypothetical protein